MAKKNPSPKISISIDLRKEYSIRGSLIYSIFTTSSARYGETTEYFNHPSFVLKTQNFLAYSKKIEKDSTLVINFSYTEEDKKVKNIGFMEKRGKIIDANIWIPYKVWSHLYSSIIHTKSEQMTIFADDLYRRSGKIYGVDLLTDYDETDF